MVDGIEGMLLLLSKDGGVDIWGDEIVVMY